MRILILCPSEICYNPRMLKAADFLSKKGAEVTVFNTLTGIASKEVYENSLKGRQWKVIENDLRRYTNISKGKWFISGVVQKMAIFLRNNCNINWLFKHYFNKAYIFFPAFLKRKKFDYILIHLVDSLPFASSLKKTTGAKLVYDCQEYFKGQYSTAAPAEYKWVKDAEAWFVSSANIILATTNVMLERLKNDVGGNYVFFRVRNLPLKTTVNYPVDNNSDTLKIIWHGLTIVPENTRGIHIILHAISHCKTSVNLFLQGNISEENKKKLDAMLDRLQIKEKVTVLPAAHPDNIVSSLIQYDIGVAGELAEQENQMLTSSNKLFEFICAGLATVVPDLPGLKETIVELGTGTLFKPADYMELSGIIDELNNNRSLLKQYKNASMAAASSLYWENDYYDVYKAMN